MNSHVCTSHVYTIQYTWHDSRECESFLDIYISWKFRLIWKANFKPAYRPNSSSFWSGNSNLLYSIFFYFVQDFSNPVLFAHSHCYSKELKYLSCELKQNCDSHVLTILEWQQQCAKSTGFDNFCKNRRKIVEEFGQQVGLKFAFQINYTQPDFLWNVNVQIACSKKNFSASFPWKSVQIYMVEWMGGNFDVFPGFQKIPCYA